MLKMWCIVRLMRRIWTESSKNAVLRTVLLEFSSKNCPSPGELFHFAFAHKSGTLIGTDVTQPSATAMCYCSAAFNNKTREKLGEKKTTR